MALLDLQQFFPAAGATAEPPDLNDPVILREIRRRLIEAGQANAGSGGPTLGTPDIMANIAPPPMGSDAPQGAPLATQDIAPGPQAGTAYRAPQPQSDGVAEARALNQSVIDRAAPGSMAPRRTPQAPPADAGPSPLESLGAILAGGGDRRQGVIGRIGGMIQGGTGLDRGRDTENLTVRALMSRGLDQDTATVIARNPDLLKSVAPTLLGAGRNWTTTEVYDAQGRRQRVAVNTADPRQTIPLGGPQADQLEQNITRDQARADNQEIQKLRTNASRSGEIVNSLDRMRQLRKGVSYEGIPLVSQALAPIAGLFGYGGGQALQSEATRMQQNVRGIGEGAVSNYERRLFERAAPGLSMSDDAAGQVIDGWEAAARRVQERAKFFEAWRARHRTLSGASAAWDRFAEENRIIADDEDGRLTINRANIGNWQPYISPREGAGQQQDDTGQPQPQPRPESGSMGRGGQDQSPPASGEQPEQARQQDRGTIPSRPTSVPPGSAYSPSRRMWRSPDGKLFDANGRPVSR